MSSHDTESTVSSTPKRFKFPSVWLDTLPLDISSRIASFLPRPFINHECKLQYVPDAISLAAVSPIQGLAVADSQSHAISIEHIHRTDHTTALIRLWTDVLSDVREVQLPIGVANNDEVRKLLSLPTITKAVIPNYPCLIRALHTGASVRSLELRLTIYCPENSRQGLSTDISQLLAKCPVENLSVSCLGCTSYPHLPCFASCILETMKQKSNTLRSLHIKCASEEMEPLIRIPSIFPNLEEFKLEHWVSVDHFYLDQPVMLNVGEHVYEYLGTLARVGMINCGSISTFIPLGSKLMELSSVVEVPTSDIMALSKCPNLRSLDILLEEGAEMFFPQNLCNLREISLTWSPDHRPSLNERYYAPPSLFLFGLIHRNKNVTKLCLKNIAITTSALQYILCTTGVWLRTLFLPIFHQDESPASRFSRLALLILRYNTKLSELEVCSASFGKVAKLPVLLDHESGTCNANNCAFCELRERIECVARVLRRRIMGFCDDGIRRLQFNLEPWRWICGE